MTEAARPQGSLTAGVRKVRLQTRGFDELDNDWAQVYLLSSTRNNTSFRQPKLRLSAVCTAFQLEACSSFFSFSCFVNVGRSFEGSITLGKLVSWTVSPACFPSGRVMST